MIEEIGAETNRQVEEVEKISAPHVSAKEKKAVINSFATFLKSRATELTGHAQRARGKFASYTASVAVALELERKETNSERYKEGVGKLLDEAEKVLSEIPANRASMLGFRTAVENLPRITIQFNQAKKLLMQALNECVQVFDQVEQGIYELAARS